MPNHIDYYMMNRPVQLGQVVSCQIISVMTWWISQVSQVKLGHVKSYWLWHDVSVRSVSSSRIMSNHISYYMMCQSGQLGQIRSCQIISAMTWCFSQVRSYHYHSHWNSAPIFQQYGFLVWYWSQCRNILPQPHSLLVIQMGGQATVSITIIFKHTLCFKFNIKNILYINFIHSCVLTCRTIWRCLV